MACGSYHTVFLCEDKTAWTCGYNNRGQLGRNVSTGSENSTNLGKVTEISDVIQVACGASHTIFLRKDKTVWTCGSNNNGELGRIVDPGSTKNSNLGQVIGVPGVTQIACGIYHTVFLCEEKSVWTCGHNGYGQLGRNVSTGSTTGFNLGQITGISDVTQIACGTYHTAFLREDKTVWTCGHNGYGQLGRSVGTGSATTSNLGQVVGVSNVVQVACGLYHAIFLCEDKTAWTCGGNSYGQLGRIVDSGSASNSNLGQVMGVPNIVQVACGGEHTAFLREGKTVWTCGNNSCGQLGRSVGTGSATISNLGQVAGVSNVTHVACGTYHADGICHTVFLCKDKTVWACGNNDYGQLGRIVNTSSESNTNIDRMPTEVFGSADSLYQEGNLLIQVGNSDSSDAAPFYLSDSLSLKFPIKKIYQVQGGMDVELDFKIVEAA